MSDEKEVETILEKGIRNGVEHYLVKWKGCDQPEDNSWEQLTNLDCKELVEDYEAKAKAERKIGFGRGLIPEKIIGVTEEPGELHLLVKVSTPLTSTQLDLEAIALIHLSLKQMFPLILFFLLPSGRVLTRLI